MAQRLGLILFWLVPLFVVIVLAAVATKYLVGGGSRSKPESTAGRSDALAMLEEDTRTAEIEREDLKRG